MKSPAAIAGDLDAREAYAIWSDTYDSDRNLTRDLDRSVTESVLAGLSFRSVLEIGSGTGKNTPFLARIGANVLCLDFSKSMIERAKAKSPAVHVRHVVSDLTRSWPFKPGSFDLISCNLVLEHIEDLDFVFSEAARALMAGGRFFICELHPYRQDQGIQANFRHGAETIRIPAFVHPLSEFTGAAAAQRLSLLGIKEWRHEEDQRAGKPPRLVSLMFEKPGPAGSGVGNPRKEP